MADGSSDIISQNQLLQEEHRLKDVGTERAFLCCLMIDPPLIVEAERQVPVQHLFYDLNRYVYELMLFIYRKASVHGWPLQFDPMSMLAVAQYLGPQQSEAFLAKTDGMQQVRAIEALKLHISTVQFNQYVQIVNDRASRVFMYRKMREGQLACFDLAKNPLAEQIAIDYGTQITSVALQTQGDDESKITKVSAADPEYFARIKLSKANPNGALFSVPVWKFPFLMHLMNGGYRRRGLFILCARPKVGKTTWLFDNALESACVQGYPTLYMDNEMSREEVYSRGIARMSRIHEHAILNGRFLEDGQEEEKQAIVNALMNLRGAPLYYVNVAGKPMHFISSVMREFRNTYVGTRQLTTDRGEIRVVSNPGLFLFDWLKVPDAGALDNAKEWQILGFLCSKIKDTAKLLDMPVIAGAQNNREAINMQPEDWEFSGESAVAGSDRLAQFCTAMAALRNLTPDEIEEVRGRFPLRVGRDNVALEDAAGAHYNQMLHFYLQRGGDNWTKGIPLYIDRGRATYEEMAVCRDANGNFEQIGNWYGRPRWKESECMKFIRERRRMKRAAKSAGPALPSAKAVTQANQSESELAKQKVVQ